MTDVQQDHPLRHLHTFGLEANAKYFLSIANTSQLQQALITAPDRVFILGGGSNVVFLNDYRGLVLHIQNKGIEVISNERDHAIVEVQAGENWHDFVHWTVHHNFGGLENLSLIPGTVGAAPIQNIGAYGVELDMVFDSLRAMNLNDQQIVTFDKGDCQFSYRNSIFKNELKGKYCILSVRLRLSSRRHTLHTHYGRIREELDKQKIVNPTIADVARTVSAIRRSKLPDPKKIGNCGSFFKNPIVKRTRFLDWQRKFPTIPHYLASEEYVKVPGGWIIDQLGWRGKSRGDAAVYQKHGLVLINKDAATAGDLLQLVDDINDSVEGTFGIRLEPEVNLIGKSDVPS